MKSFNQHNADMLTLGHHIARVMQVDNVANDFYMELAQQFCDKFDITGDNELHLAMKQLLAAESVQHVLNMVGVILKSDIDNIVSVPIRITSVGAVCKLTIFKGVKPTEDGKYSFYISDFLYYCDTFVVLDGLESISPGAGSSLLQKIMHAVDVPIIIQAGFLHYGDYEVEARDNVDSGILDKLVAYYEALGFKNINDRIGCYEESVIMLYDKANTSGLPKQMEI